MLTTLAHMTLPESLTQETLNDSDQILRDGFAWFPRSILQVLCKPNTFLDMSQKGRAKCHAKRLVAATLHCQGLLGQPVIQAASRPLNSVAVGPPFGHTRACTLKTLQPVFDQPTHPTHQPMDEDVMLSECFKLSFRKSQALGLVMA